MYDEDIEIIWIHEKARIGRGKAADENDEGERELMKRASEIKKPIFGLRHTLGDMRTKCDSAYAEPVREPEQRTL